MSATQAHEMLEVLLAERFLHPAPELDDEVAAARDAYVGLAVTEIATLRAAVGSRQEG